MRGLKHGYIGTVSFGHAVMGPKGHQMHKLRALQQEPDYRAAKWVGMAGSGAVVVVVVQF